MKMITSPIFLLKNVAKTGLLFLRTAEALKASKKGTNGKEKNRRSMTTRNTKKRSGRRKLGENVRYSLKPKRFTSGKQLKVNTYNITLARFPHYLDAKKTEQERAEEADAELLAAIASRKKLASDMELAKGIVYTESLQTS